MGTRTITRNWKVDGVLTNVTTAKLSDAGATYGVKRNDNDAVVVADGTAMTNDSTGVYSYTFTEPADGLAYTAWVEFVYGGNTYRFEHDITATSASSARITEAQVQAILQDDFTSGDNLDSYVSLASNVVDDLDTADTGGVLSDATLVLIEAWLAAHYYTVQNHQLKSEKTGDVAGEYAGMYEMGLKSSKYGQTAIELDRTGFLRKMQKGSVKAGVSWLGKVPSAQIDYVDRD